LVKTVEGEDMDTLQTVEDALCTRLVNGEAGNKKWIEQSFVIEAHTVRVSHGVDRKGEPVFRYWFDTTRVDRGVLLTLICKESLCPKHQDTLAKWCKFTGQPLAKPVKQARTPVHIEKLEVERQLVIGGKSYFARPAKLSCKWTCPLDAHPPVMLQRDGWDLFNEDGKCIAGGLDPARPKESSYPLFPTIVAVQTWLAAQ
jgi:hypothetical protein